MRFVNEAKALLTANVTAQLQERYGIWADGQTMDIHRLPSADTDTIHTARLLRQRLEHITSTLTAPAGVSVAVRAVRQLTAEQAFTTLNRLSAVRMAEERGLVQPSVAQGYQSVGFLTYDAVTGGGSTGASTFQRYTWYLRSLFDELSVELPAVFNRYSPYGLIWVDEDTLQAFFALVGASDLSAFYDEQTGQTTNFWQEDETLGWIFQFYNGIEERQRMRDESTKPRNSREMAVRNQFFTPDYVVRFLTDNALGRIWMEMTGGSEAIRRQCQYMVWRDDECHDPRPLKEPTSLTMLDPACGSMHFGLYAFSVFETIYMDAWDHQPSLLADYRYTETRESFRRLVPKLILENNIHGVEIDPRALQIAALSLWLRAQRSWSEQGVEPKDRPLILRSQLVLAEPMPGNVRLLRALTEGVEKPMRRLLTKVWERMTIAGEAGLLLHMEKEIEQEIADLKSKWSKVVQTQIQTSLFDTEEQRSAQEAALRQQKKIDKEQFFATVVDRLSEALQRAATQMSDSEGYENALFVEDTTRGFAFIEMCHKRFDVILMNPPFGEGSETSSPYLDQNYTHWCRNLVCAFFIRMQEMLNDGGRLGAIFDRTVLIKSSYEPFRKANVCGFIHTCADTGWNVLDASVETSTLVLAKTSTDRKGIFFNVLDTDPEQKKDSLATMCQEYAGGKLIDGVYEAKSAEFGKLPNSIIGYYFDEEVLRIFQYENLEERGMVARQGYIFISDWNLRLFFEFIHKKDLYTVYNGGAYSLFYIPYFNCLKWVNNGNAIRAHRSFRHSSGEYQLYSGVGYGKRGDIIDAHILKRSTFFTAEGQAIPLSDTTGSLATLSFVNSVLSQYTINLYTAQHKISGNVNLLPMPPYASRVSDIERIVNEIIGIKRWWFSLDETNLEYHGLIAQLGIKDSIGEALARLQARLDRDYVRYQELVGENDNLWADLAEIAPDSRLRQTLREYTGRRPYEELLSIDGASSKNQIARATLAAEIVQELVGMAFGRWDMGYALGRKAVPEFGDVFNALPFMPVVSLPNIVPADYPIAPPANGIAEGGPAAGSLGHRVREVMHTLWGDNASDIEYELSQLIGCDDLLEWIDSPTGFFDYHFRRYTKSRRRAPIYWPIAAPHGEQVYWLYYPRLTQDTLPAIVLRCDRHIATATGEMQSAMLAHDTATENRQRQRIDALRTLNDHIAAVVALPYKPCHDDGVPVTAAPLRELFAHRSWREECEKNWKALSSGDYDWAHLAYAIHPADIRQKAKHDWCLALTHGLEQLCECKPKERKTRKKNKAVTLEMDFDANDNQ